MSAQAVPARSTAGWLRACPTACTQLSLDRGEPLALHGPAITGWILLEHPRAWGPGPGAGSPAVPQALRDAARDRGLRINLIRRHARRPGNRPLTAFLATSRGPAPVLERLLLDDVLRLPPHALEAVAAGRASGLGTTLDRPIFLACTHGRMDACCARLGRPVARALDAAAEGRAWESTHVGGCRFGANVVSLPAGVYYGRLALADAATVVSATDAGRIAVPWYRGTAGLPPAVRHGEAFLRHLSGLDGPDELQLVAAHRRGEDLHEVEFDTARGRYVLVLRGDRIVTLTVR